MDEELAADDRPFRRQALLQRARAHVQVTVRRMTGGHDETNAGLYG